jgi:Do/DeqQ family serine protease
MGLWLKRCGVVPGVMIILAVGAALWTGPAHAALPPVDAQGRPLPTLAPMLERVTPAVVNVSTKGTVAVQQNPMLQDPFFRRFFNLPGPSPSPGPRARRETQSLGSGVVVDAKHGYILTNNHVVDHADQIEVTLRDGRTLSAKLVGSDPETDVAVIQVKADGLTEIPLADSDGVRVGDFVVAIGNPFGLGQTVTSGIVSAMGRSGLGLEGYEDFIQTDASINPGNSGGALVNLNGDLVGINTAIIGPSGGNVGIGFAIPVNMARQVMDQIVNYGQVQRGQLGIVIQDLTPALAKVLGLDVTEGAVVPQVIEGSPAEKAGIQAGDVIVAVDGRPVRGAADLRNQVGLERPGARVRLEVWRDGKQRTVDVTIRGSKSVRLKGEAVSPHLAGAEFANPEVGTGKEAPKGVEVAAVEQGSAAWDAGLRKGDRVVSVNRKPVNNVEELRKLVGHLEPTLLLNVYRNDRAFFILVQ